MKKSHYLFSILLAGILGIIAKGPYRDFIYQHRYNDLGLADFLPNFFMSIVIGLAAYWITGKRYSVWAVVIASILWEIDQLFTASPSLFTVRVFDYKDIMAAVIGGIIANYIIGYHERNDDHNC